MSLYNPSGGFNVTVVGQNDLPVGLYSANGSYRVTQDAGNGLYAPNGALRIGSSGTGAYTPSGALNGTLDGSIFFPVHFIDLRPELVTNGLFTTDTTGWTPTSAAATIASVSGELRMTTVSAATQRFSAPITCEIGKTYRMSMRMRRGTVADNVIGLVSALPTLNSNVANTGSYSGTTMVTRTVNFVATATTMYIGGGNSASENAGLTSFFDSFSVKEVT